MEKFRTHSLNNEEDDTVSMTPTRSCSTLGKNALCNHSLQEAELLCMKHQW